MTSKNRRNFIKKASAATTGAILTGTTGAFAQIQEKEKSSYPSADPAVNPFDIIHDRRGTNSIKWDFAYQNGMLKEINHEAESEPKPIPMWIADMEFQTSPKIIEALQRRVQQGIYGYTKPTQAYYRSISSWIKRHYNWQIDESWLIIAAGIMPSIGMAIQGFTEPGDKVIIQTPVFNPFEESIENNGRVVVRNSLLLENEKYVIDFDDLEKKASDPGTKMIIFCNPHNPVGRVWTAEELSRLGEICKKNDLLIVSDEIHCDMIYSWARFTTFGNVDERFSDRLIVCNSPSKSFNLPGLKTATTIIPNPELREKFIALLNNLDEIFSVNTFGTLALQTAYEQGEPWLNQLKEYVEGNYLFLKEYIAQHIPKIRLQEAEGLYLVWVDCRKLGLNEEELRSLFFNDAKVYPEQGGTYGDEGKGFVRLNIACPRKMLEEALERIGGAVSRV